MDKKFRFSVLYVEDEEKIRHSYTRLLTTLFEEVYDASNGIDAWHLYNIHSPDVVVADIVLPKLNGMELLTRIRKNDFRTRAILLTAFTTRELLLQATKLDISDYLVKPAKKSEFLDSLKKAAWQLDLIDGKHRPNGFHKQLVALGELIGLEQPAKSLTPNEAIFLTILSSDPQHYFTAEEIEKIFFYEHGKEISINAIKALIKRIRKKLSEATIENRYGHGYRLMPKE